MKWNSIITNVVLVGALLAMVWGGWKGCTNARQKNRAAKRVAAVRFDSVQYWRDLYGKEHATREVAEADRKTLELFYKPKLDSLREALHLKKKQLQDVTDLYMKATGHVHTEIVEVQVHDTVNGVEVVTMGRGFSWADEWVFISGIVDSEAVDITYSVSVPVTVTKYWKRKWWLGRKRQYVDVSSDNPGVVIQNVESIKVKR